MQPDRQLELINLYKEIALLKSALRLLEVVNGSFWLRVHKNSILEIRKVKTAKRSKKYRREYGELDDAVIFNLKEDIKQKIGELKRKAEAI